MIPSVRICRSHALPVLMTDPEDRRGPANHHPGILASRTWNPRLRTVTQNVGRFARRTARLCRQFTLSSQCPQDHIRPVAATNLHNSRGTLCARTPHCVNCELARRHRLVWADTYGIVQGPWCSKASPRNQILSFSPAMYCDACSVIYRVSSVARVKKTFMAARYNISLVGLKTKQYIHSTQILVIKRSESWTKRIEGSCSTFKNNEETE